MTFIQPHLISAHAPLISAPHVAQRQTKVDDTEYKITGTDWRVRPDAESVWRPDTRQWSRRYLPGEKEAEALDRVGTVRNAQQSSLLATERDIKGALLKIPPKSTPPAVRAPFATDPGASGEQPELFNRMKEMDPRIIESRDTLDGKELQGPFDNAMAMVLKVISGAGTSMDADPMSPGAPGGSGKLGSMFDSIVAQRGGGAPAVQPTGAADDIAGVYANGGSIFGRQEPVGGDKSLSWLRPTDMDAAAGGGDAVASEAYASSVGGMIDAFMRRNYNV